MVSLHWDWGVDRQFEVIPRIYASLRTNTMKNRGCERACSVSSDKANSPRRDLRD